MAAAKFGTVKGLYLVHPSPLSAKVGDELVWENLTDVPITVELPNGVVSDVTERLDIQARTSGGFSRKVISNERKDHTYKIQYHHYESASAGQATEVEGTILIGMGDEGVPRGQAEVIFD